MLTGPASHAKCRKARGCNLDVAAVKQSWCAEMTALRLVVFVGLDGVRNGQPQVAKFLAQGLPGDPQQAGGPVLIPPGVLQGEGQQDPVHLAVCLCVEILGIRPETLADEGFQAEVCSCRS